MSLNLPRTVDALDLPGFTAWIEGQRWRVLPPTNQWEVLRYRQSTSLSRHTVGIIYRKLSGQLTYTGVAGTDYAVFLGRQISSADVAPVYTTGTVMTASRPKKQPHNPGPPCQGTHTKNHNARRRQHILARDGTACWLCSREMPVDDRTIEHLIPKSAKGGNELVNLVLCHSACNKVLGTLPLARKIAMREHMRELVGAKLGLERTLARRVE